MSSGRPYQGFPYVNPAVIDAPSLSSEEVEALSKWRNLPTRKITTQPSQNIQHQQKKDDQPASINVPDIEGTSDSLYPHYPSRRNKKPKKNTKEPNPVIYIDLPEDSSSSSSFSSAGVNAARRVNNTSGVIVHNRVNNASEGKIASVANVACGANVTNINNTREINNTSGVNENRVKEGSANSGYEDNDEIEPVVYIDIPDSNESNVSLNRLANDETEYDFVQQTIYYDPFKECKIQNRETPCTSQPGSSQRPGPPNTLNLTSPGSSSKVSPGLPAFLSKEAYVYGRQPTPDDGFPLSPIPLEEFPHPPPSYEEASRTPSSLPSPQRDPEPPKTQVIVHNPDNNIVGQADLDRRLVNCQHCGKQVNTLVVRKTGVFTHAFAWSCMLCCLFPLTIGIYLIDQFKHRNHYCPNCNKEIGFEVPFLCLGMRYTDQE